jgi:hypothetical protein
MQTPHNYKSLATVLTHALMDGGVRLPLANKKMSHAGQITLAAPSSFGTFRGRAIGQTCDLLSGNPSNV